VCQSVLVWVRTLGEHSIVRIVDEDRKSKDGQSKDGQIDAPKTKDQPRQSKRSPRYSVPKVRILDSTVPPDRRGLSKCRVSQVGKSSFLVRATRSDGYPHGHRKTDYRGDSECKIVFKMSRQWTRALQWVSAFDTYTLDFDSQPNGRVS
jgi:hypothetical protein